MPLDGISLARLQLVNPVIGKLVQQMADALDLEQITFRITQGFRTWPEQYDLYAQGRTKPGEIVTHAKGGESWHNLGSAVDFAPMKDGKPVWNTSDPAWNRIIETGKALGLTSGADWTHPDRPHFQLTGRFPMNKPDEEARQIYQTEGMTAFWQVVNASS